ncbi:MAG: hypothetical protein A2V66_16705 [Ignavibacteria bacterium RBG_13_36_8]|nr:MAG: hypothetical protein A2V66_16705 [Ignavibacteria bacterium RBG_13_36_8]
MNTDGLKELYDLSNLEYGYVFLKCQELKVLKGKIIDEDTIMFWYREFLKDGWDKKAFDKHFEVIKRKEVKNNMLDYGDWVNTEIIYSEFELQVHIKRKIESMIREGNKLTEMLKKGEIIKLDDTELEKILVSAVMEVKQELAYQRDIEIERIKDERKKEERKNISELQKRLRELATEERIKVLNILLDNNILKGTAKDWTGGHFVENIHLFYPEVLEFEERTGKNILTIVKENLD